MIKHSIIAFYLNLLNFFHEHRSDEDLELRVLELGIEIPIVAISIFYTFFTTFFLIVMINFSAIPEIIACTWNLIFLHIFR